MFFLIKLSILSIFTMILILTYGTNEIKYIVNQHFVLINLFNLKSLLMNNFNYLFN